MGEAIAALLGAVLEVAMIFTGKAVVSAANFGRWRGEQLSSSEGRIHSPAGALSFKRDGQRVFTATGLFFIGGMFYALFALAALLFAALA